MVAPGLCAADATRERVLEVVKKFAHSWETGDLVAFSSTLDEHLLWAHPGGKLEQQRTAGSSVFSNVNVVSDEFRMIRLC